MKVLKTWILFSFIITSLCGIIYLAVQQNYRQNANDPQIQIAEDAAARFSEGGAITDDLKNSLKINVVSSLSPFMIIYDDRGNVVTSQAFLNGNTPSLPLGVLDFTRVHGEDRVTWQPEDGVRIAAVVVSFTTNKTKGFVLVGRNLREVENRVYRLTVNMAIGWCATIFGGFLVIFFLEFLSRQKKTGRG